nr:protein sym1 [Quercus suber]
MFEKVVQNRGVSRVAKTAQTYELVLYVLYALLSSSERGGCALDTYLFDEVRSIRKVLILRDFDLDFVVHLARSCHIDSDTKYFMKARGSGIALDTIYIYICCSGCAIVVSNLTLYRSSLMVAHVVITISLDTIPFLHFILFAFLNTPPNYVWQTWLEAQFPAYTTSLSGAEKEKIMDDKVMGTREASRSSTFATTTHPTKPQRALNIRNTASKFLLDQSLGAAVNTVLFIAVLALFRGESWGTVTNEAQKKFWPMIFAGQKLWPMVSLLNFTVVPVQYRMLFGSVVGVFWGIFLSLTVKKRETGLMRLGGAVTLQSYEAMKGLPDWR